MSTTVQEGKLQFGFDDGWMVLKYDDHACYRRGIEKLKGELRNKAGVAEVRQTTALDVLAQKGSTLVLMEIKDFRGHRIESKHRVGDDLAVETAIKARDTLAGVIGGFFAGHRAAVRPLVDSLCAARTEIRVILWLEEDSRSPSLVERERHKSRKSVLSQQLKKRCVWLTSRALVASIEEAPRIDGISVSNLPMAGRT